MAGSFSWVGLLTSDAESAKRFYAEQLGWEAGEAGSGYAIFQLGGDDVALLYELTERQRALGAAPNWASFVSVTDAEAVPVGSAHPPRAAANRRGWQLLLERAHDSRARERGEVLHGSVRLGDRSDANGSATIANGGRVQGVIRELRETAVSDEATRWLPYFEIESVAGGSFALLRDREGATLACARPELR